MISVSVDASAGKDKIVGTVKSGLQDLLVLKSGGSSFTGFFRDENTTLPGEFFFVPSYLSRARERRLDLEGGLNERELIVFAAVRP